MRGLVSLGKVGYAKEFKLLGVTIDNKLKQLANNFEGRKKKIRIKIAIWRKLNLSEIGNLIISKTFLISKLGYLLSKLFNVTLACDDNQLQAHKLRYNQCPKSKLNSD